jgi:acetone carboxylase gamma subunit
VPRPERLTPKLTLAERLGVNLLGGVPYFCCGSCHAALGPVEENYKLHAARIDGALTDVDAEIFSEPARDTDVPVVYSLYACPACGTALDRELRAAADEAVWDIRPDPVSLTDRLQAEA